MSAAHVLDLLNPFLIGLIIIIILLAIGVRVAPAAVRVVGAAGTSATLAPPTPSSRLNSSQAWCSGGIGVDCFYATVCSMVGGRCSVHGRRVKKRK